MMREVQLLVQLVVNFRLVWFEQAWKPHYCKLRWHQIWSLLLAILLSQWNQNLPIFEPSSSTARLRCFRQRASPLRNCCLRSCLSSVLLLLRMKLSVGPKRDHPWQEAVMLCKPTSGFTFSFAALIQGENFSFTSPTVGVISLCVWCESLLVSQMYVSTMSLVRAELFGFGANAWRRQARHVSGKSRAHSQNARILLDFRILDVLEIYLCCRPKRDHLRLVPQPCSINPPRVYIWVCGFDLGWSGDFVLTP